MLDIDLNILNNTYVANYHKLTMSLIWIQIKNPVQNPDIHPYNYV